MLRHFLGHKPIFRELATNLHQFAIITYPQPRSRQASFEITLLSNAPAPFNLSKKDFMFLAVTWHGSMRAG